jgi:hypothetical protein
VYSLSRYFGRKVQLGQANRRQKLGLVWRNRTKISQIIKDYFYLPFFLLIILWFSPSQDENVGGLANSKKPDKFPNHLQK